MNVGATERVQCVNVSGQCHEPDYGFYNLRFKTLRCCRHCFYVSLTQMIIYLMIKSSEPRNVIRRKLQIFSPE